MTHQTLEAESIVVEAIDMGGVETLEEELLPLAPLCTGCSCECK
jgi:hypothetical protein